MELFDKDKKGSLELMQLTGNFQANNNFATIQGEIKMATSEVERSIGSTLLKKAATHYNSDKYGTTEKEDTLVAKIQLPIAMLAMCNHFQQNIVSHETDGRKVKSSQDEKMAWEWMLDRDDKAMRDKYYRSLDALYYWLESQSIEEWNVSPIKSLIQSSIVKSIDEFEAVYPIDRSYYTYLMLQPLVTEIQESRLIPICGDKWKEILEGGGEYLSKNRIARRYAILLAVATAVERWSIGIFPQSITRRFTTTYQGNKSSSLATNNELDKYLTNLRRQADEALSEFKRDMHSSTEEHSLAPYNDPSNNFFNTGL